MSDSVNAPTQGDGGHIELAQLAALQMRPGAPRLSQTLLAQRLATLVGWRHEQDRLVKTYSFADYATGVLFANAIAFRAQRMDHHPDLEIGYRRCTVAWTTHDAGGITDNDCIAAARTEILAS